MVVYMLLIDLLQTRKQALRLLSDDSVAEHKLRRSLMSRIVSKSVELQLCDLSGVCSTQALFDLGPQVRRASSTVGGLGFRASV